MKYPKRGTYKWAKWMQTMKRRKRLREYTFLDSLTEKEDYMEKLKSRTI